MALQAPPNGSGQVIDTLTTVAGKERQVVIPPQGGRWTVYHAPAAATQATASQAAGAANVKNVCDAFAACEVTVGTAQTIITLNLRDGATGAGTILMSLSLIMTTNSVWTVALSGLCIVGSAATAMTLEFSAAGVAASVQSVFMSGYTTA